MSYFLEGPREGRERESGDGERESAKLDKSRQISWVVVASFTY